MVLSACGSGEEAKPGSTKAAVDSGRTQAERAVRRWVDKNDCSLMSDRYAAEGVASARAGRDACRRNKYRGLQAADYVFDEFRMGGDGKARAILELKQGGKRIYYLVRGGKQGWQIDGRDDKFEGGVGAQYIYLAPVPVLGHTVAARALIRLVAADTATRGLRTPAAPGRTFIRARFRLENLGDESFALPAKGFVAVDQKGRRYGASTGAYDDPLTRGKRIRLARGKVVSGFVGFDVPDDATITELRFDPPTSGGPFVWTLQKRPD